MTGRRGALAALVVCAAVVFWTNRRLSAALPWRYPVLTDLVMTENYAGDLGALLLGAHRLAADIAYIQLLQYYGVSEHGHSHDDGGFHDISEGKYPELKTLSTRIMRLDPFFNGPILESAGALAFNQDRPDEAMLLLQEGIQRDPQFFRYHLYLTAILFREKGNDAGLIELLLQAIKTPDCPPLFELMLGNLLRQAGRFEDAARVYLHTFYTAPQESDRKDAERRLRSLILESREAAEAVRSVFP